MIYAIRAVGTEYIKFGKANIIRKRLAELECGSPHELELVAAADWPDTLEQIIHKHLKAHNHKGEWFRFCEDVEQVLGWMRSPVDGIIALGGLASEKQIREIQRPSFPRTRTRGLSAAERKVAAQERRRDARLAWWYAAEHQGQKTQ